MHRYSEFFNEITIDVSLCGKISEKIDKAVKDVGTTKREGTCHHWPYGCW